MSNTTRRLATFTEANAWVQLTPDQFNRHFPDVATIWQTQEGRVWVEVDGTSRPGQEELAWWELQRIRSGEPVLPCGCLVRVVYVPNQRHTICTFSNPAIAFRMKLRITGRLMLTASALSHLREALCVHPHDEATVEERLKRWVRED